MHSPCNFHIAECIKYRQPHYNINMRKKIFVILLCAFTGLYGFAQGKQASGKVNTAFSAAKIATLSPEEVEWNNFIADNMCIISTGDASKTAGLPEIDLGSQSSATTASFNPLLANITQLENEHQYFRIAGTDKSLFVFSLSRSRVMFQRYLKNPRG